MKMTADHLHPIALILLAEAHVTVPVPLRHAGVVHHEEVHLKTVCTSPLYLVVVGANELNHFNTTSFTRGGWGHVVLKIEFGYFTSLFPDNLQVYIQIIYKFILRLYSDNVQVHIQIIYKFIF